MMPILRRRHSYLKAFTLACAILATTTISALAGPKWVLIYYRQIGNNVDGGGQTMENHLFREDGSPGAFVGGTNQFNLGFAVWGNATADGWLRLNPATHVARDFRVYDPGVATDQTPNFYCYNQGGSPQNFSFETHWLYVADETTITPHPTTPVYHYDLVDGINSSSFVEPPGTNSDSFSLASWADSIYQTFVVPANINQIVSCKAWTVPNVNHSYVASIHLDNGGAINTWPQIGPTATSRIHGTVDFVPVIAHWPVSAVTVTPGQRYALKVQRAGGGGFNCYATNNNNYTDGQMYLDTTAVPGRDLIAAVVGVTLGTPVLPLIVRSPAVINRSITVGDSLGSDNFTVANGEVGTLNYSLTETTSWLSVNPTSGSSTGEADSITINYNTAPLSSGNYAGVITISSTNASNSPQTVTVNLTVGSDIYAKPDHDQDFDVDLDDFGWFQACFTGEGIAQNDPNCLNARLDLDEDVDTADYSRFLQCLSGANVPAEPSCWE